MLLDTSGLLAMLDSREPLHQQAIDRYHRAIVRITHGYVLAELVALGNARKLPPGKVLEFVTSLIANQDVNTVWPGETLTSRALTLLISRQGHGYSLCDAMSFVLMREHGVREALSADNHFLEEGFEPLLR